MKALDKYMAYDNNLFYVGCEDHIKILNVDEHFFPENSERGPRLIQPDPSEISTIEMERKFLDKSNFKNIKIHGFFINNDMSSQTVLEGGKKNEDCCILVALENYSNQIDLNTLHLLTRPGDENFNYEFRQYRQVIPQEVSGFD